MERESKEKSELSQIGNDYVLIYSLHMEIAKVQRRLAQTYTILADLTGSDAFAEVARIGEEAAAGMEEAAENLFETFKEIPEYEKMREFLDSHSLMVNWIERSEK